MLSIQDETTSKPFVKWVGGKRSLIHAIVPRLPETFKTYYEPFVGGGALYFALADKITRAVLSDINPELITTYQTIKNQPERLIPTVAQFLAVCSASTLAMELHVSSPFSSQLREKRGASLRRTPLPTDQLRPTTNSDKLSGKFYHSIVHAGTACTLPRMQTA
jgi:site-specific DNA-adenine methylase